MAGSALNSGCVCLSELYVRGVCTVGAKTEKGMRPFHVAILAKPTFRDPTLHPEESTCLVWMETADGQKWAYVHVA